jgi:hypothetical protein
VIQSDPQQFLKNFFGDGNAIQWSRYAASSPTDAIRISLEPWIIRFQKQQSPYCLPRVEVTSQQTLWYVLCTDARQVRSVRETLQSFIGPTYANFNGELATLSLSDPIEQLCQQVFGQLVFRLPVLDNKDRAKVNLLLGTMMDFRDRFSSRSIAAVKPIGRLLRDLEMAIIARNEESANQIYTEIRSRGRLSATNLTFMQVRILAEFDRCAEILLLPNLSDLLIVRRPKRVSEQLASAVYRHLFLKFEDPNNPTAAISAFRNDGIRFQHLVRSTEGFTSRDALKFAVLAAVGNASPKYDAAKQLVENSIPEQDRPWCQNLLLQITGSKPSDSDLEVSGLYKLADIRYEEGNFDEAFRLYLDLSPNYPNVCRILETAVEIDDILSAKKAIEYLESSETEIQNKILNRRVCAKQIEILFGILGRTNESQSKDIDSLTKWFQCVDESNYSSSDLKNVLEYSLRNWINSPDFNSVTTSNLLLKQRNGVPADVIRNAVPLFIKVFLVEMEPGREHKLIYRALTDLLIYDDSIGSDDLAAVEKLIETMLTIAPSQEVGNNDFVYAVSVTKHLWETIAAPRNFDWALSVIDLLINTGTQQHCDITQLFLTISSYARRWNRRMTDGQISMLQLLAQDLDLSNSLDGISANSSEENTIEPTSVRENLRGKSIAVYSMTERIARRFGQLAEKNFDGIKIHYFHDKSLTDRMKNLANSADIFIVNTWDAKHAATNGIKDNRPSSKVTLEPMSKSPMSLLKCLNDYANLTQ